MAENNQEQKPFTTPRNEDEIAAGKDRVRREQQELVAKEIEQIRSRKLDDITTQLGNADREGLSLYEAATLRKLERTGEVLSEDEGDIVEKVSNGEHISLDEYELLVAMLGVDPSS